MNRLLGDLHWDHGLSLSIMHRPLINQYEYITFCSDVVASLNVCLRNGCGCALLIAMLSQCILPMLCGTSHPFDELIPYSIQSTKQKHQLLHGHGDLQDATALTPVQSTDSRSAASRVVSTKSTGLRAQIRSTLSCVRGNWRYGRERIHKPPI